MLENASGCFFVNTV